MLKINYVFVFETDISSYFKRSVKKTLVFDKSYIKYYVIQQNFSLRAVI